MDNEKPETQSSSKMDANKHVQTSNNRPGDPNNRPGYSPDGTQGKIPPARSWLIYVLILLANFLLIMFLFSGSSGATTISYTVFKDEVGKNNVSAISSEGNTITGRLKTPITYTPTDETSATPQVGQPETVTIFTTTIPAFADPGLESYMTSHGVEISAQPIQQGNPLWLTLLIDIGPALLFIGLLYWYSRRSAQQGGAFGGWMGFGQSKARRYDQSKGEKVTFKDVAGIDEARDELVEIVDFLKDPKKYTRLGGTAPKGVLLTGAPGTGKTLLAKAVAGEANVPFFSMSASEFVEMIVGVGASRVRDLFKQARENAPAIIFIDEIDAIGRTRGQMSVGGTSEQEQTLNQILTEMDGFSSSEGVIVLAATNQPDVLDKALLRPGRFDRRVVINLPDKAGRVAILKVHTRNVPLAEDVNLGEIAATTPGFSGADIKNLVNEAALLAARRGENAVCYKDFMESLEKIALGPARPIILSHDDKERIAYHEGGHTIMGLVLPGSDPVKRVTIVPRGQALGVTYQRPDNDKYNYPELYIRNRIIVMMGGRAAEEIVFGTKTTGAQNDIEQATNLAYQMVTRWGMSEKLGTVELAPRDNPYTGSGNYGYGGEKPYSEETAKTIDSEILRILNESHNEAKRLLSTYRKELDSLAGTLLERETLDDQQILQATGLPPAPPWQTGKLPVGSDGRKSSTPSG